VARARLHTKPPAAADALQDLDLFRQSNPNDVEVRMYMADAHMMLSQGDEAVGRSDRWRSGRALEQGGSGSSSSIWI